LVAWRFYSSSIKSKSSELRALVTNAKTKSEIREALVKSFDFVIAALDENKDAELRKEVTLFGKTKTRTSVYARNRPFGASPRTVHGLFAIARNYSAGVFGVLVVGVRDWIGRLFWRKFINIFRNYN